MDIKDVIPSGSGTVGGLSLRQTGRTRLEVEASCGPKLRGVEFLQPDEFALSQLVEVEIPASVDEIEQALGRIKGFGWPEHVTIQLMTLIVDLSPAGDEYRSQIVDRLFLGRAAAAIGTCHGAAILAVAELAAEGVFARVARGRARYVNGQHSWVVVGDDVWDDDARIVDLTIARERGDDEAQVCLGSARGGFHFPHGAGSIWAAGMPLPDPGDPRPVHLDLSGPAESFIGIIAAGTGSEGTTLDLSQWEALARGPMVGWPAGEVIAAMHRNAETSFLVPIDRLGMATMIDPHSCYVHPAFASDRVRRYGS